MSALGVGVDEAWDRATVPQLQAYGATFVARYVSEDTTGKNLTLAEANAYRAGGIAIVTLYEYWPADFRQGYAEGQRVAQLADRLHRACGGDATAPIYFAVDVQVDVNDPAQWGALVAYCQGLASVLGLARVGVYAEYDVIRRLFDLALITYGFQTYAWSSGQWDPRAQLRQVANGVILAGHDVDRDESWSGDFGQWGVETMLDGYASVKYPDGIPRSEGAALAEALWVLLRGRTFNNDPTPLDTVSAGVAQLLGRAPVAVDPAQLASALIADPAFVPALREAFTGLTINIVRSG